MTTSRKDMKEKKEELEDEARNTTTTTSLVFPFCTFDIMLIAGQTMTIALKLCILYSNRASVIN